MPDVLKLIIGRILAAIIPNFLIWLGAKTGIIFSDNEQAQIITKVITEVSTFILIGYAVFHKWIGSHFNPGDASTKELMNKEKREQKNLS